MCGIVGYVGKNPAQAVLIDCLSKLEYRGYDSCGIAIGCSPLTIFKDVGRIGVLANKLPVIPGNVGVGHTRWATHGEPSANNAHPHMDCFGRIAVVHNGVIDNYLELRERLIGEGHNFSSETDTEVIPHLIEKYFDGDLKAATSTALEQLTGTYAIVAVSECEHVLVAARRGSPLIVGAGKGEYIVASDVPAILSHTDNVIYLEDGDMAVITEDSLEISNNGAVVERQTHKTAWDVSDIQKSGFEHFMLKEIFEQPRVARNIIAKFLGTPEFNTDVRCILGTSDLTIIACGTSYHAGLLGKYIIEELTGIPVTVEVASEINCRERILRSNNVIGISQSGETADVLTALKKLKANGSRICAITNVFGSSIARVADKTIYTEAGPEVSVAATKTFIAQVISLCAMAACQIDMSGITKDRYLAELIELPQGIEQILNRLNPIEECARYVSGFDDVFFIAKGVNVPSAMEAALKLKEVGYVHAEGYIAGELKHGPFALLSERTPVVAIVAHDSCHGAMLTSIEEIRARKAPVISIVEEGDRSTDHLADYVIEIPVTYSLFTPVLNAVVLQLLAYFTAKFRGCPIDKPRNLAKSVTVE